MGLLIRVVVVGIGATALMDFWGVARSPLFGLPRLNYAMIGRWVGHMPGGRFRHDSIAAAAPVAHERLLGWGVHYAIGIVFAALLAVVAGPGWFARPTLGPALLVGLATVGGPFLLMQPGMGAGIAGRRTPRPWVTRIQTLLSHTIYGFGLYAAAWAVHFSTLR